MVSQKALQCCIFFIFLSTDYKAATNICPFCFCLVQSDWLMPKNEPVNTTADVSPQTNPQCTHAFWHKMSCVCLIKARHALPFAVCSASRSVRHWGERWVRYNHHLIASLLATSQVRASQNNPGTVICLSWWLCYNSPEGHLQQQIITYMQHMKNWNKVKLSLINFTVTRELAIKLSTV